MKQKKSGTQPVLNTKQEPTLRTLRDSLPNGPGAYLFKDRSGRVIYVGKAKNLRKRVLSYLRPHAELSYKTSRMIQKAGDLDYILTSTENEAFILESNLIKKHMPRYNIILRDDKHYPCLRMDAAEPYPRLNITRKIKKDGALYFGPFSSAQSVRSTLKVIDRAFQLRKCKSRGLPKRERPCLNHQLGLCLGPCTRHVPVSQYGDVVRQVKLFLNGHNDELVGRLKREMERASGRLDFEEAARFRDQIRAIERTAERQHVVSPRMEDQDVVGLASKGGLHQVVILFVRRGCLVGSRDYLMRDQEGSAPEVMEAFLKQYYHREVFRPEHILISQAIDDLSSITAWLCDLEERKIIVHRPLRGKKLRMVNMATANAENLLNGYHASQKADLMDMARAALILKKAPRSIEGLDISNLGGDIAVGSTVSFVDGLPHRSGYRNYKIRKTGSIDDYGMMAELVERRVSMGQMPDLFLVDGGKGHLSVVKGTLDREAGQDAPEVVAIAKRDENRGEKQDKIYIPGRKNPLGLRADHPVLLLMMRIRDEAHRRAITYHRSLKRKAMMRSKLDLVPGIGKKRRSLLLNYFKDMNSIAKADPEELAKVPGIDSALAGNIFAFFHDGGPGE